MKVFAALCALVNLLVHAQRQGELGDACDPSLEELACLDPNAECPVNETFPFCQCKEGFVEDSGICRLPNLGEECNPIEGCADENTECIEIGENWICDCIWGFLEEEGECKKATGVHCMDTTECVSNAECTGTSGAETCECVEGFLDDSGYCKIPVGGECSENDDCVSNAVCSHTTDICFCQPGYLPNESGSCRLPTLGEECLPEVGCHPLNSECAVLDSNYICSCEDGFVEDTGHCLVEAGGSCTDTSDCVSYADCDDGTCTCRPGYIEELGQCKVPAGWSCSESHDCVSNAECTGDICMCLPGHEEVLGDCIPFSTTEPIPTTMGETTTEYTTMEETTTEYTTMVNDEYLAPGEGWIEDPCDEDNDCNENEHLACNSSLMKCICADGYLFDTDIFMCTKIPRGLGDDCEMDEDCNADLALECDDELKRCY